ncbi:Nesprin-1-like 1, partial [Homarus americanus]
VLVGEAAWSGERVSELRQLARQIQLHVAEDSAQDTPLVAEVERLGFRITNLTEAITQLSSNLALQVDAEEQQQEEAALKELQAGINGAQTLLALPEPGVQEAAERAGQLQDQLVALGGSGGPIIESGPTQVVEAWQIAVRDTHCRYEQVVAGLGGDDEQLAAALTTWKQYVDSVEAEMTAPAPASREGLHEASRLCQVHRSILTTQTNVLQTLQEQAQQEDAAPRIKDLQGRLHELILRHKTVLTTVSEREQILLKTIATWETYRVKVAQLQTWILALEQEKQGLQLRQVARRRLEKVIHRLQSLLEQLCRGEEQVEDVAKLCQKLVASCDPSIHSILKAELASLQQRVTNMRAGVETWLSYLNRSSDLWRRYEEVYTKLNSILSELQAGLLADLPSDFSSVQETIKKYNETTASLEALSGDLSLLRTTREEMVDSLTPADLRLVTQRMWRVTQLQAELLHQYRLRISTLEDRLELWQLYDTRYQQFLTWAKDMEAKIDGGSEQYIDTLIRKLEHDYQEDINSKRIEKLWLTSEGEELISCSNEDQAADLKVKVESIETTWKHIHDKCNSRKQKLQDIVTTINKAEVTLAELKEWLFLIEKKLSSPVIFQESSKKEIDRLLEAEEEVRKEIEKQSGTISSVLNLCDMVIRDCTEFDANGDTDSLQEAHHNLERRWGEICTRSAERKVFIKKTWKMWQELIAVNTSFVSWLTAMESRVKSISSSSTLVPYSAVEERIATVHELQPLIHDQTLQYENLNQNYRVLARPYGRENGLDQKNEIRTMVKTSNARFHILSYRVTVILRRLMYSRRLYEEFENTREQLMSWLNDFDLKISGYEHQSHADLEYKKRALLELVAEYEKHEKPLKDFDNMITYLFQRSCKSDCLIIEESLAEYWITRKLIHSRLLTLQEAIEIDITQITTITTTTTTQILETTRETMRLSEERSIPDQDDDDYTVTLMSDAELQNLEPTLSLTDMSLIGAVGGRSLAVEMRVALDESKRLLAQLEEALKCPTPQGAEVDKMYYSFSKQLAGCRSSVDLLSSLVQHTGDDSEARELHPEIDAVIEEFKQLEVLAQAKQQRLKENSETSSLTCPLCCRRNWQQFENDMWRLEQWLTHAEATQSTQHNPPTPMEQLEEVAQDHREFLMDLDGHKSVIMSLNVIGKHLAEHTRDKRRATRVRDRLTAVNQRWEAVCAAASVWQAKLQTTLMGNAEFHTTITDLLAWTDTTEENLLKIAAEEDMEETALRERVSRVLDVRAEVERCEPRVASLHDAAQHLLPTQQDDQCAAVRERLALLARRLQLLRQMCSQHLTQLSQLLGQDFTSSLASLASSGLYESAEFSFSRPTSPSSLTASFHSDAQYVQLG